MLSCVKTNREAFMKMVLNKLDKHSYSETQSVHSRIAALELKVSQLEKKFDRLYEDRLEGLLSDRKFKELSAKCETEQDEAAAELTNLREQLNEMNEHQTEVEQFAELAGSYDEITELDKELLNRLVDSIVVGDRVKTENGVVQKITVNYKFVGAL